jgi:poly(3-hydroxybutyrate) depolymerase
MDLPENKKFQTNLISVCFNGILFFLFGLFSDCCAATPGQIKFSRMRAHNAQCIYFFIIALCYGSVAQALPAGKSQHSMEIDGIVIGVHTYKPPGYSGGPLLVTLHGLGRNVGGYRDYVVPLADRHGLLVVAPLFDRERFPVWRYQTGGLVRDQKTDGDFRVEPKEKWTGQLLLGLIDAVRAAEGRPDIPYYMVGHSAGGQALSRFAAFVPNTARRIVIANPSTYLWPSRNERFPFGFGGLPESISNDEAIRRYLAQPITVLLGTADVKRGPTLNVREGAERQGPNRYERGLNAFRAAQQIARDKGWEFNWRLVEVPGVSHSARRMYAAPEAGAAIFDQQ